MEQVVGSIQDLSHVLRDLIKSQTRTLHEVMSPLKKLPDLMETQMKHTQEGFNDTIRAHMLVAIAQHKGGIEAKKAQIESEGRQIEALLKRIDEETGQISRGNLDLLDKVDKDVNDTIEKMDGPAMDIMRVYFSTLVHWPLQSKVLPQWIENIDFTRLSSDRREKTLKESFQTLLDNIEKYRDQCRNLKERAASLTTAMELDGTIEIPVCVVEYEKDGHTEKLYLVAPVSEDESQGQAETGLPWLQQSLVNRMRQEPEKISGQLKPVALAGCESSLKNPLLRKYFGKLIPGNG
jgi:hypothetical protein